MMPSFHFPHGHKDEYVRRLQRRVDAAAQTVESVLERLRGLERASPSTWDAALREAEAAYERAFGPRADFEFAEQTVNAIDGNVAGAFAERYPNVVTERGARLPLEKRQQAIQTQLDVIRALVDDYYQSLRDVETDDNGFIIIAGLGAAAAAKRGISRRKAEFYGTDQAGLIYNAAWDHAAERAGLDGYIWGRTTSANPRDRHLVRVGQFFRNSDPIDHPGEAYHCKCDRLPPPRT